MNRIASSSRILRFDVRMFRDVLAMNRRSSMHDCVNKEPSKSQTQGRQDVNSPPNVGSIKTVFTDLLTPDFLFLRTQGQISHRRPTILGILMASLLQTRLIPGQYLKLVRADSSRIICWSLFINYRLLTPYNLSF
jgi:hypothetical protein